MSDENDRMLALLTRTMEWFETPRRRRQILRRLKEDTPLYTGVAIRLIMAGALLFIAAFIELVLAYYTNRNANFFSAFLILIGLAVAIVVRRRFAASMRNLLRRMALLPAVILATAGGAGIVWLAWWSLDKLLNPSTKSPDPIDITKLALTIAGGIGAVVALVVAYRRQRDIEQGRFVERFGAAAAQLGASQVAVRIAGVYAMAGVANESKEQQRQQCIDVLCGYLRLPYSPERGSNYQTKHVKKVKNTDLSETETEDHFEYLQNDREVRLTILSVLADHLRNREHGWSESDFDFRGAYLEDIDFSGATFKGEARFGGADFVGNARFYRTKFSYWTNFSGARFSGDVGFNGSLFSGVRFQGTTFEGMASFDEVDFDSISDFSAASFSDSSFWSTNFWGGADFLDAKFSGSARFDSANFDLHCNFERVKFGSDASFEMTSFKGGADFTEANFGSGTVDFRTVRRWGFLSRFEWSEDRALKPSNVKPAVWPSDWP
ncbi:pentapeptide repeat-containing protein [Nocardia sp. CDC153]|uniref:pentapeptide repeat-containing protein n=1 Tax=Nocardia sp. CDC153 TaxID=3112167 RepID=UPI002DBD450B|nr:pentapeptide repeat-containing protein [Nocardia sp. CDC153]MEC3957520.1 pentapeptide repeat-containing protein [Nocardia sp. CDC153]